MKIKFHINYHTNWGEELYICGTIPTLGNGDAIHARQMKLASPDAWEYEVDLPENTSSFDYYFIVKAENREWRFEWGAPHRFVPGDGISLYNIFDSWQDMPSDKPYYSSAFVNGMLCRQLRDQPLRALPGTICLKVWAPMIAPDEVLAVCGEGSALGNWDPHQALKLNDAHYPLWECNIPTADVKIPFDYKFLILNKKNKEVRGWEDASNRIFGIVPSSPSERIVIDGIRFVNPRKDWKGAGTAIPVFSIRTEDDFGVGDFIDIKKMVDWCEMTGQKVLQLLPVNDTTKSKTWVDSYPYSANSTFALHPMYLRLEAVGTLKDKSRRDHYVTLGRHLNELDQIDYEAVNNGKMDYLREIYAQDGTKTAKSKEYKDFVDKNEYWLRPYAAWSVLRDTYNTADNTLWGEYAEYDEAAVERFISEHRAAIDFYYFVQYHLDRQLREVRDYAHQHGVVLKGDIPIGVGRESVDAWQKTRLFNMNCQAGAPPDDFSVLGQNWGFPTYNWEEMARDGFAWWKDRFRKMSDFFDAYRIDHILGFFRIWQIPLDAVHGLLGYFNPALPYSKDELRNNFDFWIDPEVQCKPLILEWMLTDFFGETTDEVKSLYLDHIGDGRYRLKEGFRTQREVARHFAHLEKTERNERMLNGLLGLIDDVLFIEDPYQKGHYHPRISAQYTYQFRNLTDYEKWCFNRLYNDFFYHRHDEFWRGKAMWKLPPLLDSTGMLACGEDLGMIPDCVPQVMHALEILSLEIQRMPKDPKTEFGDTWHYPYFSVCTSSTHDMPGIRAWWESDPSQSQRFFNNVLHEFGQAPYFAEPWLCEKILWLQLASPSMLCIIPLQDWLSADGELRRENPHDEQINEPANPTHYWRYRMHITVENLMKQDAFNNALRDRIAHSGR
ncbi:MAG: 4-alpha-glucanotransferase [Muribaculaceae bacterium]|nr:4-alpha-glucanotransferase [Muribaculaceae bacterium]